MKLKRIFCLLLIAVLSTADLLNAQECFQIESILVDACAPAGSGSNNAEGLNEMMRFRNGNSALNINDIEIDWASTLQFNGIIQFDSTGFKTTELNNTILSCGLLIEPPNGIIPALKEVLLITSYRVSAASNSFANLTDTLYVIYHNHPGPQGGHFQNYSTTVDPLIQTTTLANLGNGCVEVVSYDKTQLVNQNGLHAAEDGATVDFTVDGVPTYSNHGCTAPVDPLSADWQGPQSICQGVSLNLNNFITGNTGGTWTGQGVSGSIFSSAGLLGAISINYTVQPAVICASAQPVSHTEIITILPAGNASWTASATICASASPLNLSTLVTGTAGGTWSGTGVTGTSFNPSGLSGAITINYIVGIGTCFDTVSHSINVINLPRLDVTGDTTYCNGEIPTALHTNPVTGAIVHWYTNSGLTQLAGTGQNFTPAMNQTTTYYVNQSLSGCTSVAMAVTVTYAPPVNANWTNPGNICATANVLNLTSLITGNTGGTWSGTGVTGSSFNPQNASGAVPVTYTVFSGTCGDTLTQIINVINLNPLNLTGQTLYCHGEAVEALHSNPIAGATVTWYSNPGLTQLAGTGSAFTPPANQSATYYAIQTLSGCVSTVSQITIEFAPTPVEATWTNPGSACATASIISLNPLITGTTGGTWSGTGVSGTSFNPSLASGPATITYIVVSGNCADTLSQILNVIDLDPLIISGQILYCNDITLDPLQTNPAGGAVVTWYTDPALTQLVETGSSYTPALNQSVTYYAIQSLSGCVSGVSDVTLEFNTVALTADDTLFHYCEGTPPPVLDVASDDEVKWYSDAALTTLVHTGTTFQAVEGQEFYYVTATTGSCVTSPTRFHIIENPLFTAEIQSTAASLCSGQPVTLTSNSPGNNEWNNGSTADYLDVTEPGTYTLTRVGLCNTATDEIIITGIPVTTDFTTNTDFGYVTLTIGVSDNSINADECLWFIDGSAIIFSDSIDFTIPGEYHLMEKCSNASGCSDTLMKIITVLADTLIMEVPNVFSPNGDAINDLFQVNYQSVKTFSASIFNRWGNLLYKWDDVSTGWDGSFSGSKAANGTYFYVISGTDIADTAFEKKGAVMLIGN